MDEAGSKVNLLHESKDADRIRTRTDQIAAEKEAATHREDYEAAARLRDEERKLESRLKETAAAASPATVDVEIIQQILESRTGIPVRKLQKDEQEKMKDLPDRLNRQVIGQGKPSAKSPKPSAATGPDCAKERARSAPFSSSVPPVSEKPSWPKPRPGKCSAKRMP